MDNGTVLLLFTVSQDGLRQFQYPTWLLKLVTHWISRFGVPARITSDQGRQFESAVFAELMQSIGTTHLRTTPYHPQSNGLIERWHRVLKTSIFCHDASKWVQQLPTILLGLRVVFKPDINASPAELVYGTTLRIPGEFFFKNSSKESSTEFVTEFRDAMENLRPTETAHHSINKTFISKDLYSSTHVFVRNDSIRPSLTHPYDGPYLVLKRNSKFFTIKIRGSNSNVSIDRLKPYFSATLDVPDIIRTTQQQSPTCSSPTTNHTADDETSNTTIPSDIDLNLTSDESNSADMPEVVSKNTTSGRRIKLPVRFR